MLKIKFLAIFCLMMVLLVTPVSALEIVIDPGHDGNEQNRGGPAFTVDGLGSELFAEAEQGDTEILVNAAEHFTHEENHNVIEIGTDTYVIADPIDNSVFPIVLTLATPLSQDYPAGTSVTVEDFLVQVMGRRTDGSEPENWDPTAEYYDTLTYSHELPASEWGNWIRKEDDDNNPLGTLEVLNTWRMAREIEDALPDTATIHLTKDDVMDIVTRSDRAQMYAEERPGKAEGERGI